ncbi:MAG: hypothetical protein N3B18_01130 [Desulfobacterota bacterium]|nr:hypothetical protein [Thermodesulfobacteriota bacterium]
MYRYHIKLRRNYVIVSLLACALCLVVPVQAQAGPVARCKGHGSISFEGTGTVSINGEGVLIVSDNASVTFTITADGTSAEPANAPECIPNGTGYCIYVAPGNALLAGPGGKAEVTGNGMQLWFAGSNIGLTAQGNGKLILKGYGIYLYDKTVGRWSADRTGSVIILQP